MSRLAIRIITALRDAIADPETNHTDYVRNAHGPVEVWIDCAEPVTVRHDGSYASGWDIRTRRRYEVVRFGWFDRLRICIAIKAWERTR